MEQSVLTAVYEDGVLRPLTPLQMPEKSRVEIVVQKVSPPNGTKTPEQQLREALIAAGLSQPDEAQDDTLMPLSEGTRVALAERLRSIGPLSALMIQEREGVAAAT